MKTISIDFSNMWGASHTFTVEYFLKCFPYLRLHYDFVLDRQDPDVMFYSVYRLRGEAFPGAQRASFTRASQEITLRRAARWLRRAVEPGFYHFGITMAAENTHPNHIYMPLCCLHLPLHNNGIGDLIRQTGRSRCRKEYFCDFIYSNANSRRRVEFFQRVSQYKRVESLGAVERNNDELAGTGYRHSRLSRQAGIPGALQVLDRVRERVFSRLHDRKAERSTVRRLRSHLLGQPASEARSSIARHSSTSIPSHRTRRRLTTSGRSIPATSFVRRVPERTAIFRKCGANPVLR